jgi:mycothiol synthase
MVSISGNVTEVVEWAVRPYREGDLAATVALDNLVSQADGLSIVLTQEEQQVIFSRPGFQPERRVLVVEGPRLEGVDGGALLGYATLPSVEDEETGERTYTASLFVHPTARHHGLARVLMGRLVEIARQEEAALEGKARGLAELRVDASEKQHYLKALSQEIGLKLARQFWIMECPLVKLDEPQAIEGVTMRNYRVPTDHPASMDAYNRSFRDHYGFHPTTPERWHYRFTDPTLKPDLSWVAETDAEPGKIAGFCLCNIYEQENRTLDRCEGWIGLLGTVREWRGKGLGRSLLLHGLHSLRAGGLDTGVLGVDSVSPTGANRLYESVGFRTREIWLQFRAPLEEVRL